MQEIPNLSKVQRQCFAAPPYASPPIFYDNVHAEGQVSLYPR